MSPTPLPGEILDAFDATDAVLVNLYQRVNPGVVYIEVFADSNGVPMALGSGSGFVVDSEGHIVTNSHVVAEADEIEVTFAGGGLVEAEVVGLDPYSDLAVIQSVMTTPVSFVEDIIGRLLAASITAFHVFLKLDLYTLVVFLLGCFTMPGSLKSFE